MEEKIEDHRHPVSRKVAKGWRLHPGDSFSEHDYRADPDGSWKKTGESGVVPPVKKDSTPIIRGA